jgi:hypothetical protein
MCAWLLAVLLALLPVSFIIKLAVLVGTILYYFLYSFVRFALTVLLVSEYSVTLSPFMYFTIFQDFIFVVIVYSYLLYRLNNSVENIR